MKPGPENIYQCPNCENLISCGSLRSGNTFGALSYSDGKVIAPMLPEFPSITKCSKCENIFWIEKAKLVGTYDPMSFSSEFPEAEEAVFLSLEEYHTAIEQKLYTNSSEETFLRMRLWWNFNDRVRSGEELFRNESDRLLWEININKLMELLDYENLNERLMIAELNRNLGNFEKCMEIIASIDSPDLNRIKTQFKNECLKKNENVFQLNPPR